MTTPLPTVSGADLHDGDTVMRPDGPHLIDHLDEYPGRFVGDHARVAHYADGGEATVVDHQQFHVQSKEGVAMRFQDHNGPLKALGIFHDGRLVAEVPDEGLAQELRNRLNAAEYPGCEVLARCNTHPDTAAVDCDCWLEDED